MQHIIDGAKRFRAEVYPVHQALFNKLADQQHPEVLFITCADSRVDPAMITQTLPGELFVCRNAGNIVPPHGLGPDAMVASIEYAVAVLQVKHIVVCGHTNCGAMKGLLDLKGTDALPNVQQWLRLAQPALELVKAQGGESGADALQRVTEENVLQQLQNLRTHPFVAAKLATGQLQLHGWVYDLGEGQVCCGDEHSRGFTAL